MVVKVSTGFGFDTREGGVSSARASEANTQQCVKCVLPIVVISLCTWNVSKEELVRSA
jgi:hypothetical protein